VAVITRIQSNLVIESTKEREIADSPFNQGMIGDEAVLLQSSSSVWRRVHYKTEQGMALIFLTNEMQLKPGFIAFLYLRRWDEGKCFDTWKNDFSQGKAWGRSRIAIESHTRQAIISTYW
jgi:hypothetical protein